MVHNLTKTSKVYLEIFSMMYTLDEPFITNILKSSGLLENINTQKERHFMNLDQKECPDHYEQTKKWIKLDGMEFKSNRL